MKRSRLWNPKAGGGYHPGRGVDWRRLFESAEKDLLLAQQENERLRRDLASVTPLLDRALRERDALRCWAPPSAQYDYGEDA